MGNAMRDKDRVMCRGKARQIRQTCQGEERRMQFAWVYHQCCTYKARYRLNEEFTNK
jgi:hypothetical protein